VVAGGKVFTLGWRDGQDWVEARSAEDGRVVWSQSYAAPRYGRKATGDEGLYDGPSSTPSVDAEGRWLYTLGIDGELRQWATADGTPGWRLNLYEAFDAPQRDKIGRSARRDYGYPGAPLVWRDQVIVEVGARAGTVMGFAARTGTRLWASQYQRPAGHTGGLVPLAVEGVPCLAALTLFDLVVMRLDPGREGETVGTFPWTTEFANNVVTPVAHGDSLLITAKYNHGAMTRLRVSLGGLEPVWTTRAASGVCTPVVVEGSIYWITQQAYCLDFASGEIRWKGGRFGDAGSLLATGDGKLIAWAGRGRLALLAADPQAFRELAALNLQSAEDVWPHPALAGGRLYCRDRQGQLRCLRLGAP
jgi:outer membrane protein assembly factor BamB